MRNYIFFMLSVVSLFPVIALAAKGSRPVLNTVAYQVQVKDWVSTDTANVIVAVHATLGESNIESAQKQLFATLEKLVPVAKWHIGQFQRSVDQSGLENLYWQVSARMPFSEVAVVQKQIKTISQPGRQYKIASIDYSPSMAVLEKAKIVLRDKVYAQANIEIKQLNKAYPAQSYFVHKIVFLSGRQASQNMIVMAKVQSAGSSAMPVARELVVQAQVELGSLVRRPSPSSGGR